MKRVALLLVCILLLSVLSFTACNQGFSDTDYNKDNENQNGNVDIETHTPIDESSDTSSSTTDAETSDDANSEVPDNTDEKLSSTFTAQSIKTAEITEFRYWLYTPENPRDNMPLVVYLHGGSGKGDDLSLITAVEGFPKFLKDGDLGELDAYVIIPQVPSSQKGWMQIKNSLKVLVEKTIDAYNIDKNKVTLTGHSMGGTGTWSIASKMTSLFTRIAPASGSIEMTDTNLSVFANKEIWAFVGMEDTIVAPDTTIEFIEALNSDKAKLTKFENADHFEVPALTYKDEEVLKWLTFSE